MDLRRANYDCAISKFHPRENNADNGQMPILFHVNTNIQSKKWVKSLINDNLMLFLHNSQHTLSLSFVRIVLRHTLNN